MEGDARRRPAGDGWSAHEEGARVGRCPSHSPATEKEFPKRKGCVRGITFDAGGLIGLDRKHRRVLTLLARATELGMRITVPATALAQAIRNPARQARLSRLIRQSC